MRVLCVWLPMWSVDLARLRSGSPDPLLLTTPRANVEVVARCCEHALRAGVEFGMHLAHARALVDASIEPWRPTRDRERLERLARWAMRFTPVVGIDPTGGIDAEPDALLLDIAGCERLCDEATLRTRIRDDLRRMGLRARIGIGRTIGEAWARARHARGAEARGPTTTVSNIDDAIRGMPLGALRVGIAIEDALHDVGITTIGGVLDLPRASLPARFGRRLLDRVDQLAGDALELIEPVRHRDPLVADRIFNGPTTHLEAIEACVRTLLDEVVTALERRGTGVRRLDVTFARLGADARTIEDVREVVHLSEPSRHAPHLWTLLRHRVEALHLGNGIERVTIEVLEVRWANEQATVEGPEPSTALAETLDTLVGRLGRHRVLRPGLRDTHLPDEMLELRSVLDDRPAWTPCPEERPSVMFDPPEPAMAVALRPDHPPQSVRWRGRLLTIRRGEGPERLAWSWWNVSTTTERAPVDRLELATSLTPALLRGASAPLIAEPPERDYYRVQDESGTWFWVYREHGATRDAWFIHGIWG